MKTLVIVFFIAVVWYCLRGCAHADLPSDFYVKEDLTIFQSEMTVGTDTQNLGTITRDVFSLTTNFTYTDSKDNKIARAEEKFFSWGHVSKIYDENHNLIGQVKEEIFTSWLSSKFNTYTITDASGNIVGKSERVTYFATNISITDASGAVVATINRPYLNLLDKWTVHVETKKIDPRLILFIGAYKTEADNDKN